MYNRLATIEVYTVPRHAQGRAEATKVGRKRQNLILTIYDIEREMPDDIDIRKPFFAMQFPGYKSVRAQTEEIAKRLNGTHSRRTDGKYDDASFKLSQRDELIRYVSALQKTN